MHVPVPEHAPDQPVKLLPAAGVAESVTVEPSPSRALQLPPQSISGCPKLSPVVDSIQLR